MQVAKFGIIRNTAGEKFQNFKKKFLKKTIEADRLKKFIESSYQM